MSLDDEQTQASITAYEAALNLFTDRIQERRLFADYLNEEPPKNTILFFHGDGGNGKSWLLRILRERYCKQLPPASWVYVRDQEDDKAFIAHSEGAEDFKPVPSAYLDFADINHDNPPRDWVETGIGRFCAITELRGGHPAEMALLRQAYEHVLGG